MISGPISNEMNSGPISTLTNILVQKNNFYFETEFILLGKDLKKDIIFTLPTAIYQTKNQSNNQYSCCNCDSNYCS